MQHLAGAMEATARLRGLLIPVEIQRRRRAPAPATLWKDTPRRPRVPAAIWSPVCAAGARLAK
jgi:hypothetical protein